jgi:hypothetical protein
MASQFHVQSKTLSALRNITHWSYGYYDTKLIYRDIIKKVWTHTVINYEIIFYTCEKIILVMFIILKKSMH